MSHSGAPPPELARRCSFDQGNLDREPEGRRRQDDLLDQSRRGARRARLPRPLRRHGSAGEHHRRSGNLALRRPTLDGGRPVGGPDRPGRDRPRDRHPRALARARHPGAGLDRGRALHRHRPRDGPARRARRMGRAAVRRGDHRLATDAGPAHHQRARGEQPRHHSGPDAVLRHQGPHGAHQGHQHHQAQAEPRPRGPRPASHVLRRTHGPRSRDAREPARAGRPPRLQHHDQEDREARRGAAHRQARHRVRHRAPRRRARSASWRRR